MMARWRDGKTGVILTTALCLSCHPAILPSAIAADAVFSAMEKELARSKAGLAHAEKAPLYYLGYTITDRDVVSESATLGALDRESQDHWRTLDVDVRVGSAALDNTHEMKGQDSWQNDAAGFSAQVSEDADEPSLRAQIWKLTDRAFKGAQTRYTKVQRNLAVTAAEEDTSGDFSPRAAATFSEETPRPRPDLAAMRERLKALSLAFKAYPFIYTSNSYFSVERKERWLADSDGARIRTGNVYIRMGYHLATRTEDGMDLERRRNYDADRLEDLPSDAQVKDDIKRSIAELEALRKAPLVEPYTGPAILKNRACAVFFHEILGHRLESQRQKSEHEGQTFAKKLGEKVVADFISVTDDPTLERFHGQFLRGFYRFDDEGAAARPAVLIADGVLKGFLQSRSPIRRFPETNGHGRRETGRRAVSRMANTIVTASKSVPYADLRQGLIAEIKRQGKPYGLVFDDIAGGFTGTRREGPQSFKVLPLLVYRVFPDGRPDEAVRGVDIVGTPLTSFTKILAAADDADVFDGSCGAESGFVPVSAVAPSVLISEIEVEKRRKSEEKPPVLPPPYAK